MWATRNRIHSNSQRLFSSLAENFNWRWNMNAQYISEKAPRR
jgi:hypothetical protein